MKRVIVKGPALKLNGKWCYDKDTAIVSEDVYEKNKKYLDVVEEISDKKERTITIMVKDETINLKELKQELELYVENYKKDGPDFIETKKYLTETKTKLEEYKLKYTELFNQENVMSYINDKGLDSYYIDLYKNEIVGDIEKEKNDKTVENSLNDVIDVLNTTEEIIDFLIKNKGKWSLENDGIVFDSDSLLNEYETLVSKL